MMIRTKQALGIRIITALVIFQRPVAYSWTIPDEKGSFLLSRRQWGGGVVVSSLLPVLEPTAAITTTEPSAATTRGVAPYLTNEYFAAGSTAPQEGRFFFPTLTPPFWNRATFRYTTTRNQYNSWAFEQLLTFVNVTATIRCNVVQLQSTGGLWVHSPQWPTGEFCYLLDELQAPVEHIVLPCNALEHKAPMKAFVDRYPAAQVWIAAGQYGPFGKCGNSMLQQPCDMGYRVDGILGDPTGVSPPWATEFDLATLYVDLPQNAGPVSEVAFFHRPSKTLIATDAVVFIPSYHSNSSTASAPEIFATYFDADTLQDPTFWPRTACQAVFLPLRTDQDGKYPGFEAIKERLVRAPILRAFADGRAPDAVREWTLRIGQQWDFDRILTSHFASPIAAGPRDFMAAFGYLLSTTTDNDAAKNLSGLPPIACRDWELLDGLDQVIAEYKLGSPTIFDYKVGCQ